jgi:DDE superfamily endonuclease
VRRDPRQFGIQRARWRLLDLLATCDWLELSSPSSLCHLLRRLGISYQRGRDYVHSPDPHYAEKLAFRDALLERGRQPDRREVVLLQDELTYYRQPSLARAYEAAGRDQSLARRSHRSNTATRLVSTLDVLDGRVLYRQGSVIGIEQLVRFYPQVCAAYPQAERLWIIQDNWSIHFHPDLLVALEKQESRWPRYVPPRWPKDPTPRAVGKWGKLSLPVQLVPLPTYASWLNPIEKLWRWLKQDWLHLHRLADHLTALRTGVASFLDQFAHGSQALLRYVGLFSYA